MDGLTIVGAYAAVGHPKVDALEAAYVSQLAFYPEHNAVMHWRWAFILEHVPQMRTRHLYDDLTDVMEWGHAQPAGDILVAVYDLAVIQHRFWDLIYRNGYTLILAYGLQAAASQVWQRKLLDRIEEQKTWRRNSRGKLRKPVTTEPKKVRSWYH